MATTLDIIKRSMRLVGALGEDEDAPSDSEASDALDVLNSMLDGWATERLMLYQEQSENFSWPSATTSRTIGSGGNFNTTRPLKIESAFVRNNNIDYTLDIIGPEVYDSITAKSTQADPPTRLFYDPGFSLGTIYMYGVPIQTWTLFIRSMKQFTQLALTDTISLPPGYRRCVEYNLAVEAAPEFGAIPSALVLSMAASTKRHLKNINQPDMTAMIDPIMTGGRAFNIYAG